MQLLDQSVSRIVEARRKLGGRDALLVGISGIDGSGKGFVASHLDGRLRAAGWNVATISADDWLNLPGLRTNESDPAKHFYDEALRLDEMFERLILPLKQERNIDLVADRADPRANIHREHRYFFREIDIVLLEGIFLFKRAYRDHFDLRIWIDCSFEIALQRAIARGQEGLPPAETARDFKTIYFPAQRIHFAEDRPSESVEVIVANHHWTDGAQV